MHMEYFLVTTWLLLYFWLIPKISFISKSGLTALQARLLLACKIVSGIICAIYLQKFSSSVDYLYYNSEGQAQYQLLLKNPLIFFTDFQNDIHTYGIGGLFSAENSFWAYLRFNLLFKFIAILNLLTHGNFYLNTAMFCSLVFWGHLAFYKIYREIYSGHKLQVIFATFFLPSALLYTSCIHKDGIIFLSLGVISYAFYRMLILKQFTRLKYVIGCGLAFITIFLFRNYVLLALMPAMLAALLCRLLPYKKRFIIGTSYLIYGLLFFLSGLLHTSLNLPAAVVQRKTDFATLIGGNTDVLMNELRPTFYSFMANLPQALNHYLLRPFLWEFSQPAVIIAALELLFYQVILVLFIFFRKKLAIPVSAFNIFGLLLLFNMILIIGYTIPNIGAIVRYRSIFWVFLLAPMLCNIDWQRLLPFLKTRR